MNRIAVAACLFLLSAWSASAGGRAPQVLTSVPAHDATDVPLDVGRLVVVFDRDMDTTSVGIAAAPDAPRPPLDGAPAFLDPRTFKLPLAKLAEGTRYALVLSDGFRSADGVALGPVTLSFTAAGAAPQAPIRPPSLVGDWSGSCGDGKLAVTFDAEGTYRFQLRAGGVESSTGRYRLEGGEVVLEEEGLDAVRAAFRLGGPDELELVLYGATYALRRVGAAPPRPAEASGATGLLGVWYGKVPRLLGEQLSDRREWSRLRLDLRADGTVEVWLFAPDGTDLIGGTYVLGEERDGAQGRRLLAMTARTRTVTHRIGFSSLGLLDVEWLGWMRFVRWSDPPTEGEAALADAKLFLPGTWVWRRGSEGWDLSFAADGTGTLSMEEGSERPLRWSTGPGYVSLQIEGLDPADLQFDLRLREEQGRTELELSVSSSYADLRRDGEATQHGVPLHFGGNAGGRLPHFGLDGLWVEEGPAPRFRLDIYDLGDAAEAEVRAEDGSVRRVKGSWSAKEEESAFHLYPKDGEPLVGDYHALSARLVEFAIGERVYRCRHVRSPRHAVARTEAPEVGEELREKILGCLADLEQWSGAFDDSTLAGRVKRGREVWECVKIDGFEYVTTTSEMAGWRQYPIVIVQHVATGLEFSLVPGGRMVMGDKDDKEAAPPHEVTIEPFLACRTEVPQEAWDRVGGEDSRPFRGAAIPITGVTWPAARAWCEKAGFRLPSEAEWEYLCRSGNGTRYCFDDEDPKLNAWSKENSGEAPMDVGLLEANAFCLCDVHGNVEEWCEDDWHDSYEGAPTNGSAWKYGMDGYGVVRGGSVVDELAASSSREMARHEPFELEQIRFVGFRPVVSLK